MWCECVLLLAWNRYCAEGDLPARRPDVMEFMQYPVLVAGLPPSALPMFRNLSFVVSVAEARARHTRVIYSLTHSLIHSLIDYLMSQIQSVHGECWVGPVAQSDDLSQSCIGCVPAGVCIFAARRPRPRGGLAGEHPAQEFGSSGRHKQRGEG